MALVILALFLTSSIAFGDNQNQNVNVDQARQDYRAYLEQLKTVSRQYSQLTGQMKQFLKEEGVPEWDENTGKISIKPYTEDVASPNKISTLDRSQVLETDNDMTLSIDVPGVKKDSIKVAVQDGKLLHITATRKIREADQTIEKMITLPAPAQEKGTHAKYEDGVLTIVILKAAKKEINVPIT